MHGRSVTEILGMDETKNTHLGADETENVDLLGDENSNMVMYKQNAEKIVKNSLKNRIFFTRFLD